MNEPLRETRPGLLGRTISRRGALAAAASSAGLLALGLLELSVPRAEAAAVETVLTSRFPGVRAPAETIDIAPLLQEFAPGAYLGWHTHDGGAFALVLGGQMTVKSGGADYVFQAGKSNICGPGVHTAGNDLSSLTMRRFMSFVVPAGGPLSSSAPGPFTPVTGPRNVFPAARATIRNAPAVFDLVQLVVVLERGAVSAPVALGGPSVWLVTEGEITADQAGATSRHVAGQQFLVPSGQTLALTSGGPAKSVVAATVLLPPGAPLPALEPAAAAAVRLPSTGGGGAEGPSSWVPGVTVGSVVAAAGLVFAALGLRSPRRQDEAEESARE